MVLNFGMNACNKFDDDWLSRLIVNWLLGNPRWRPFAILVAAKSYFFK